MNFSEMLQSEPEATVFIHTATAIYAFDEDSVCRYVIGTDGWMHAEAERCVGAQFVACLDMNTAEGLAAEPLLGRFALLVGKGPSGRTALIKTGAITKVVEAGQGVVTGAPTRDSRATMTLGSPQIDAMIDLDELDPRATLPRHGQAATLPN